MTADELKKIIQSGEKIDVEFKRKYVIIRICQQLYFSDTLFS